jgi:FkbM family methyltransferase
MIRFLGRYPYRILAWLMVAIVRFFPDRLLIHARSNSTIIRKMGYARHDIFLQVDSDIERNVRLTFFKREPETIEWIETFFKPGDVFFDISANVGAYSLVAAKFCNGDIKVFSFEPGSITFPQLCKNVIIHDCQDCIIPLQIALSEETNLEIFNYNNLITGGVLHTLGEAIDYKGDISSPTVRQSVLAYKLDDLVKHFPIPTPNHIKLDADEIEFGILCGAQDTLANPGQKSVILEFEESSKEPKEISEYLTSKGLECHSKYRYALAGDVGAFQAIFNYILVRPEPEVVS